MKTRSAIGVAIMLIAALATAGCSGSRGGGLPSGSAPSATRTSKAGIAAGKRAPQSDTTSSSATKSSLTKATPTSNGTAVGAPGVPEAARQHTKAGAAAFAEYFYRRINALYRNPASGTVESLSLRSCSFCNETSKDLREMAHNKQRFDGPQIKAKLTKTEMVFNRSANVFVTLHQIPANRVDEDGDVVDTISAMTVKSVNILKWVNKKGWRVEDVEHE